MKPLSADQIRGNWATLVVPWTETDALDLDRLSLEIDALIRCQVDGIYSHGTAGEFHTQTEDEFDQVCGLLAARCNAAGMPFQLGVSHMSAQISLERLKRVLPLQPSAVQVILPDWFPLTEEESIRFLARMAETASGVGLVLYNPPHAKRVLRPAQIGRLAAAVPSLIGLKTAGGDDAWFAEMRERIPQLSVFVPGHLLASGFQQGAHGAYSNVACLNPAATQTWTDLMRTDLPAAFEIESRLRAFMSQHIAPFITERKYCNAACDRLLCQIGGWADVGATMRWPYRSIPAAEAARLRPIAAEMLPEFVSLTPTA
ncbi:dihydrodipicolinate synthase family protein [Blastopirellula marina]|uniref:Dihydrodipicolinate synthase family protein n=1 Tax=Blastopirellula marina TaxID=124 RepID=A0A2S8GI00_9BACT|nr:dihydrodipicolinate synthase family protein [Blastopirellula marina]PQO43960.1 dihydrodipicolinate synthase family protein [Blastopirellula marina]